MTKKAGDDAKTGDDPLTGRILSIDDYPMYAQLVMMLLTQEGGHTVQAELVPVNLEAIQAFKPDLIIITLVRKLETIGHGALYDFYTEVDGAEAFREISLAVKAGEVDAPIIVTAIGVLERELPKGQELAYMAFVEVPQKLDTLLILIAKALEAKAKSGRVIPK